MLTSTRDVLTSTKGTLATSAVYDSFGRLISTTSDDAITITVTYDALDRVVTETHNKGSSVLKNVALSYNNAGELSGMVDSARGLTRSIGYARIGSGNTAYKEVTITDTFSDGSQTCRVIMGDDFANGTAIASGTTLNTAITQRDEANRIRFRTVGSTEHEYRYETETGLLSFDSALSVDGAPTYTYAGEDAKLTGTDYSLLDQSASYTYTTDREMIKSAKIGTDDIDNYTFDSARNLKKNVGDTHVANYTYAAGILTSKETYQSGIKESGRNSVSCEEDHARLTYAPTASWTRASSGSSSGGYVMKATKTNATLTFTAVGNQIDIIGIKSATAGKIEVTIDGKVATTVNCANTTSLYQQILVSVPVTEGKHTVSVKAVIAAPADRLNIDKIRIWGLCPQLISSTAPAAAAVNYEDDNASIYYASGWKTTTSTSLSGGSSHRTTVNGAEMSFSFKGTKCAIIGTKAATYGKMKVYLDENPTPVATINSYSATSAFQQTLATITTSPDAAHKIKIVSELTPTYKTVCVDKITVTGVSARINKWYKIDLQNDVGETTYSYNSLGQRAAASNSDGNTAYTWEGSRLVGVLTPDTQVVHVYDGNGQRVKKTMTVGSTTTEIDYIYDGLDLLKLTSKTGSITNTLTYLYGEKPTPVGGLYTSGKSNTVTAFEMVSDKRGDVRELRDSEGTEFARFDYDAYGNIRSEDVFDTNLITEELAKEICEIQPLRYAGYVWDAEIELYYCSQRFFDPTIGAFISKDPVKADGELSLYTYCIGDPINKIDQCGKAFTGVGQPSSYYAALNDYYARLYPSVSSSARDSAYNRVADLYGFGIPGSPYQDMRPSSADEASRECNICHLVLEKDQKAPGGWRVRESGERDPRLIRRNLAELGESFTLTFMDAAAPVVFVLDPFSPVGEFGYLWFDDWCQSGDPWGNANNMVNGASALYDSLFIWDLNRR